MRVQVDLAGLRERQAAAVASLREEQPAEMKAILDGAAADERGSHDYQNRSGDAELSTQAGDLVQAGDFVSVEFGMGVDYAIYLDRRGLTQIVEIAGQADTELEFYFEGERDRIAGL